MRQLVQFKTSLVNCLSVAILFLAACTKEETTSFSELSKANTESGKVALDWMRLSVQLTPEMPGYTPPIAARTFAYLGLGIYESVVLGIEGQPSFKGKITGLDATALPVLYEGGEVRWSLAVNECMKELFGKFYRNAAPAAVERINKLHAESKELYSLGLSADVIQKSIQFGQMMAKAIYNYSLTDGQDEAYLNNYPSNYTFPEGQGIWDPSSSHIKKPMLPYWGDVRCFLKHASDMDMPSPPAFSTLTNSQFYANALDVRNRVRNLDENTETMVKFWNDDQDYAITMAGHMEAILISILESENKDLAFTANAFAKIGMSMHDATVNAWRVKYKYNILRPETYIRENIDKDFLALINPQSTPEYSSSSSALAMACSEVLSSLFGYNYAFTDRTHEYRKDIDGTPRSYKSFQQMADEIAQSFLYGGIHYRFSLEAGQQQGAFIGKQMIKLGI